MKTDVLLSSKFGRMPTKKVFQKQDSPNVVVYTRVSSKEQADKNMSLETQRKTIQDCVDRTNRNVLATFGGTYESAKTDGRKEFQRMLEFIKKSKGSVSEIMVYSLDRFSRTGGAAIKLANDLREKFGVAVYAVTQPVDTSNPSGVLSQGMHLLFSEFDNKLRSQRVVAGMKEKFEKGIWVIKPPFGYDTIKINGERQIILNQDGKRIKRAWEWKIQGMKNEAIVEKLRSLGVNMYKQKIHRIFKNPFYCGMLSHGMLNGKVVEGKHEKMISREVFLKVNNIIENSTRSGIPHKAEDINLPLKVFVWCLDCQQPFTGYIVKKKHLYYYKCRTKGCKCNKSMKEMHSKFESVLSEILLKEELAEPILYQLQHTFDDLSKDGTEKEQVLKGRLTELSKKVDTLEEKYFITGEMNRETFDKFMGRFREEQAEILREIENCGLKISNHTDMIRNALEFCRKLPSIWASGGMRIKEKLQKLLFPDGLAYDRVNGVFRTNTVNSIIAVIARLSGDSALMQKGLTPFLADQSRSAVRAGFEPAVQLPVRQFSKLFLSATQAPHLNRAQI